MSDTPPELPSELKRVADQISSLRRELQATTATLGRIERRLKNTFPNYPATTRRSKKVKPSTAHSSAELNEYFDHIVKLTDENSDEGFETAIRDMDDSIILAMALEVGVSSSSKLTKAKAIDGLRKRVQESLQLQFKPISKTETDTDTDTEPQSAE